MTDTKNIKQILFKNELTGELIYVPTDINKIDYMIEGLQDIKKRSILKYYTI